MTDILVTIIVLGFLIGIGIAMTVVGVVFGWILLVLAAVVFFCYAVYDWWRSR